MPRDRGDSRTPRVAGSRQDTSARTGPQIGRFLPRIALAAWPDGQVALRERWGGTRSLVLVAHAGASPGHGGVERDLIRFRAWRERSEVFAECGYDLALLSSEGLLERGWLEWAPHGVVVLSDEQLQLAEALRLPTLAAGGERVYEPLTLILHLGVVEQVLHACPTPREDVDAALCAIGALRRKVSND